MINAEMRLYNYYLYNDKDAYGQERLSADVQGSLKISIEILNNSTADNIKYKDCSYIGFTNAAITDKYVIEYGEEKLKVMYVNPKGRFKQAFLKAL